MTMQGSKGLTFDTVIVVGVEEGYVPYPRSDPSEERRLLYVAMTRATDFCVLSFSGQRIGPLARSGRENLGRRTRSALLEGVLDVQSAADWIQDQGWT
jgi:DNA helicase-2/ATP-dependent DNA helicase PcrA